MERNPVIEHGAAPVAGAPQEPGPRSINAAMDYFPVFLDIKSMPCVVVGGGEVAARKVDALLKSGALVTVIAPTLCKTLEALAKEGTILHQRAAFSPEHLEHAELVIAATDNMETNRMVSIFAQSMRVPVNVVDNPALCTFIMPAVVDRSPLLIAISSGSGAPVLASLMRAKLETLIPAACGRLAELAATFREKVKKRFTQPENRRRFWEKILHGPIAELVLAGRESAARQALQRELESATEEEAPLGEVYLVGGGPGNPELLTLRALRLMQQADVVLYDRLVAPAIVEMARRDAERIYVGKERNNHALPQEEINELLVKLAKQGKRVLRLKGGDPFIFGRGGEEIETLSSHGIPFQIVPGVTAASGVAAFAGIPLTHRDYAHSCIFVTGHLKDGTMDLDWDALARPQQTVVIYMGLQGVAILCRELVAHGMPSATPAAVVQKGTTPQQRVITGTLETLPGLVAQAGLKPPTMILVGEVVKLHNKLAWFEPHVERAPSPTAVCEA